MLGVELLMDTGETARIFGERYVLGERLTAGDTREVWRAHDDVVSRAVALKIFFGADAANPDWQQSFRVHADRLVALSHPGIAKVLDHGESNDETWLAMAFVPGAPLGARLHDGPELGATEALDLIGQTALALAAAHDVGIVHGALSPDTVMVRDGGVISLIGFAIDGAADREDDLTALQALASTVLATDTVSGSERAGEIAEFLTTLSTPHRAKRPADANEIGRTALALAARAGNGTPTTAIAVPAPRTTQTPTHAAAESSEADAQRKMVRNRLIVLGTIVVVGGAALLRFVGEGAGDVTVPQVANLKIDQAELKLTTAGLRSKEQCIIGPSSGGVVVRQSPTFGHRVKAGATVTLTYNKDSCP